MQELCKKWKIIELSVFGSILRSDFRSNSDVDLLVEFEQEAKWNLFEQIDAEDELSACLGRRVDLIEKDHIKWVIKDRVLEVARVIYAA